MLLTGSPGGRTIINTVFTIVLGVTEYGLNGRQAVDLARMHHQWLPDRATLEEGARAAEDVLAALRAMGHEVRAQSGGKATRTASGSRPTARPTACSDKRTPDSKASVPQRLTATAAGR